MVFVVGKAHTVAVVLVGIARRLSLLRGGVGQGALRAVCRVCRTTAKVAMCAW